MRIDYARVSTTEQNLGLQPDDLKPAFDASVDLTEARPRRSRLADSDETRLGSSPAGFDTLLYSKNAGPSLAAPPGADRPALGRRLGQYFLYNDIKIYNIKQNGVSPIDIFKRLL